LYDSSGGVRRLLFWKARGSPIRLVHHVAAEQNNVLRLDPLFLSNLNQSLELLLGVVDYSRRLGY
jgi:hypothetical protein